MTPPATSWREKLHECETHADRDSRIGWLRRTYARIYRFLISQYGAPASEVEHPPMPFVDRTHELDGKAARTLGEIRHTLKNISANQPLEAASQAPREKEVWVTVAVESKRLCLPACIEWLGSHGVECRTVTEGRRRVVRVPREQADEAFRLLARAKEMARLEQPVRREPRVRVYRDDNTIQQRARFLRTRGQLSLIAFASCWGVLLCVLVLHQIGASTLDGILVAAAVLCILTLTEFGLHLMRRAR